jgi:hypothetical protein
LRPVATCWSESIDPEAEPSRDPDCGCTTGDMHDHATLTREQLHELVWNKPMSRLAAEFGISDVGLKKVCARHNVPTPPRGYWAKLGAGQAPRRPRLPPSKDADPIEIRVAESDGPAVHDELSSAIAEAKSPDSRIVVSDRLQSPCDLVREAKAVLEDATPDHVGILERPQGCVDIRVSRKQLSRALRIADVLLKEFARRNWEIAVQKDGTFVHVDDAPIAVFIEESLETVELPPKPELSSSYSFHYDRRETERRPSGHLLVGIREASHLWNHTQQRNWRGSDKRVLEQHLSDVIVGMLKLAVAIKADIAKKAREAQREQERQRTRQAKLEEQRCLREALEEEKARVRLLLDQAARWRESQYLREFVEEACKRGAVAELGLEGNAFADWITWATCQADRLDPFAGSPPSILDDAEYIEHMCDGLRGWP